MTARVNNIWHRPKLRRAVGHPPHELLRSLAHFRNERNNLWLSRLPCLWMYMLGSNSRPSSHESSSLLSQDRLLNIYKQTTTTTSWFRGNADCCNGVCSRSSMKRFVVCSRDSHHGFYSWYCLLAPSSLHPANKSLNSLTGICIQHKHQYFCKSCLFAFVLNSFSVEDKYSLISWITDEGSLPEMRIWSILLIYIRFKMVYTSR